MLQEAVLSNLSKDSALAIIHERAKALVTSPDFHKYFKVLADMNSTQFDQFTESNAACWNEMIRVRASSLCTTCSGRGHLFFSNNKGLVSKESCSEILTKCSAPLLTLLKLVKGIHAIHPLLEHLEDYGIKTTIRRKVDLKKCEIYSEAINSTNINSLVESFLVKGDRNEEVDSTLCSTFLHLNSKTFIEFIESLFRKPIDSEEVKVDKQMEFLLKVPAKSSSTPSRRLKQIRLTRMSIDLPQLHHQPTIDQIYPQARKLSSYKENALEGDVKMLQGGHDMGVRGNIDSSYTSFLGAKGTSNNGHGLVFNLTRTIP